MNTKRLAFPPPHNPTGGVTVAPPAAASTDLVVEIAGATHRFVPSDAPITIGRASDNDVVVADDSVSAAHATLRLAGEGWRLVDHSRFGVYRGDERIDDLRISDRVEVRLVDPVHGVAMSLRPESSSPQRPPIRPAIDSSHRISAVRRPAILVTVAAVVLAAVGVAGAAATGLATSDPEASSAESGADHDPSISDLLEWFERTSTEPGEGTPGGQTPSEGAPGEHIPDDKTTSEQTPSEQTPSEQTPDEHSPDEHSPDEDIPGEDAPGEHSPDEDIPDEDIPDEDAPNEQAPSELDADMVADTTVAVDVVDRFWSTHWSDHFTGSYAPPKVVGFYDGTQPDAPTCNGRPLDPDNAFYCPAGDYVAWDVSLMRDGYRTGDSWVYLVVAHEWGHAVQARLVPSLIWQAPELQADCLAGAALYGAEADGTLIFERGDKAEIATGLAALADDNPWTDSTTHGDAFERIGAFDLGRTGGVDACLPIS